MPNNRSSRKIRTTFGICTFWRRKQIPDPIKILRPVALKRIGCFASIFLPEASMPKFVIERELPGAGNLSDAELKELSRKSVSVLKGMGPEIQWLHSYVTGDKIYCVYLAPDEATVREHAKRGGFPANRVSAVRRLIDPDTAG
jgi:hypothetical protein